MAKGTEIVVSADPKGVFEECLVSGTPKPGVCMEIVPSTAPVGGRFTYRAVTRATGAKGPVVVLCSDPLQGKLAVGALNSFGTNAVGDAYVTGTRGFIYWPAAGEELNMQVTDVAGTADDVLIGDLFGVETVTGALKANSAYGSPCFQALEAVTDPTATYMLWVKYLGNQA